MPTLLPSFPLLSLTAATLAFASGSLVTASRATRWAYAHIGPVVQGPVRRRNGR